MTRISLTYEEAQRQRRQVTAEYFSRLDVTVLSGRTDFSGPALVGRKVFVPILRGKMWTEEKFWFWNYRSDATAEEARTLPDMIGISSGDAITVGQLLHLGIDWGRA